LDVAGSGDVVFQSSTSFEHYDILRYRGGIVTQLTTDPSFNYSSPRTDGINVTYVRFNSGSNATMLFDTTERVLTTPQTGPGLLNNGWIAYSNWSGKTDVIERAPDG